MVHATRRAGPIAGRATPAWRRPARTPGWPPSPSLWGSFSSPEHDLRAGAPSISAPTLLAWGRRDPVIPLRLGRRAAQAIPGAELVVFDAGHSPQVSDPEGFAAKLVPFADAALATQASSPAR